MSRALTALSLFFLVSIPALAEDFRDAKFGMSPQEVRATEEDANWEAEEDTLGFATQLAGNDAYAVYIFVDERFVRGVYLVVEQYLNKNDYLRDFEFLDELLTKKYGSRKDSETTWTDDSFKDSPSYHGNALQQGHLEKYSEWETQTALITHSITGANYEIIHRIDYESLEMSGVEEGKVLDDL